MLNNVWVFIYFLVVQFFYFILVSGAKDACVVCGSFGVDVAGMLLDILQ